MKNILYGTFLLFYSLNFASAQQITGMSASRFVVASVEQIELNWTSFNEHDWCYFDIKKEVNYTGGYNTIHTMYAAGNTTGYQSYQFTDFGPFGATDVYCYRVEVFDDIDLDAVCEFYVSSFTACDNSTGIGEPTDSPFLIYPSPTNGKVSITNGNLITSIEVYNTLGEVVYVSADMIGTIDISDQPDGIYFVTIRYGGNIYCEKMVKQ